jgi:aminoglycoside 2'-N-acetyltransferase I
VIVYRQAATATLDEAALDGIWALTQGAFPPGDFTRDDLSHAMGGQHFLAEANGQVVGHASVVARVLAVDGRHLRTGYVEAVAVARDWQGQGIATALMSAANAHIRGQYELGALGTGHAAFYERLGWRVWAGPTWVRTPDGLARSADEDGGILWLPTPTTPTTPPVTGDEPISCEWRPGDAW